MKPMSKAHQTKCLNLKYGILLSSNAFSFSLRRYSLGGGVEARAAVRAALAVPGQPAGLAVVAACSAGGEFSHLWAATGATPKVGRCRLNR